MKNENYITIQGWMINELGLKGNELILYAIIYGFSQDGEGEFYGSLRYIQKAIPLSRPTVIKIIRQLTKKGLIIKTKESHYKVVKKVYQGGKESLPPSGKETLPNKYNTNNNIYTENQRFSDSAPLDKKHLIKETNHSSDKNKQPNRTAEPFSLSEEIEKLSKSKRKDLRFIARYLKSKKTVYPNRQIYEKELRRLLKESKLLLDNFQDKEILAGIIKAKQFAPDIWKLSTVYKILIKEIKV